MVEPYCPDRGDLVWLSFDPQRGHEQTGRRPALVLSPELYNSKAGLIIVCPVTTSVKGYPFEVQLPEGLAISGVILSDQIKNFDWKARKTALIGKAPQSITDDVIAKITALLG